MNDSLFKHDKYSNKSLDNLLTNFAKQKLSRLYMSICVYLAYCMVGSFGQKILSFFWHTQLLGFHSYVTFWILFHWQSFLWLFDSHTPNNMKLHHQVILSRFSLFHVHARLNHRWHNTKYTCRILPQWPHFLRNIMLNASTGPIYCSLCSVAVCLIGRKVMLV
jgi:hypothetical protein